MQKFRHFRTVSPEKKVGNRDYIEPSYKKTRLHSKTKICLLSNRCLPILVLDIAAIGTITPTEKQQRC